MDLAGSPFLRDHPRELPVPCFAKLQHLGVRMDLELGMHTDLLLEKRGSLQLRHELDKPDPVGKLSEEEAFLKSGVPAADDDELLRAAVEGSIAGGAEVDAGPDELLLAGYAEPLVRRSGGDDRCPGAVLLAAGSLGGHVVSWLRGNPSVHLR